MCTAATYKTKNSYFGRNLDYEFSYGETAVIIPRNFPFHYREAGVQDTHYAMIGIAYIAEVPANFRASNQPKDYPSSMTPSTKRASASPASTLSAIPSTMNMSTAKIILPSLSSSPGFSVNVLLSPKLKLFSRR